jgi:RNA 2',3'-cyclic 3'-phosphodiesterase
VTSTPVGPHPERIRAFVALDLDLESTRRLGHLAERLRRSNGAPLATWTPETKMHLTVKFLGDALTAHVTDLAAAVESIVHTTARPRPAAIRIDGLPRSAETRVVIAAVDDPDGALDALARRIEDLGAVFGFARESRAFRPHVTLARLKRPHDTRHWLRPELVDGFGEVRPTCLAVYRSVLDPCGAKYAALARFDFTG